MAQEILPPEQAFRRPGFQPGQSGNPNGRPPGIPNETTRLLKTVVLEALDKISGGDGGVGYLMSVAVTDPKTFCALLGRVLPLKIEGGMQVSITAITRRVVPHDDNGT